MLARFLILFFCAFCSIWAEEVFDIFDEELLETNSYSSSQGLLSSLIANHVSTISGEFVDNATDCVLAGSEPLVVQRFYSQHPSIEIFGCGALPLNPERTLMKEEKYCCWQFNHLTRLNCFNDLIKHAKHAEISAFIPHAHFSQMLHRSKVYVPKGVFKDDCQLDLMHQKGVTNCSSGAISGRTNPKNVKAILCHKHRHFEVMFGSGDKRSYAEFAEQMNQDGTACLRHYIPVLETKANGNQIVFDHAEVSAYNPSKDTLFSKFELKRLSTI